jgi:hypothetical protein
LGETSPSAAAIDYWSAYGLKPDVLREICERVFALEMV